MPIGRKTGGRAKGTPNKQTHAIKQEIGALARGLFDADYWADARVRLKDKSMPPAVEARLLAYAFGEPKQSFDVSGQLEHVVKNIVHEHHAT